LKRTSRSIGDWNLRTSHAHQEGVLFASSPRGNHLSDRQLQIVKFVADARLNQKEKFSLRAFHGYLWKNGNVRISSLRWGYLGLDEEIEMLDAPTSCAT